MSVIALVGRPNAGKSSLYNALTGGHAKVGNFPGITVDVLESTLELGAEQVRVVDLPGVYSVEAQTDPESDEGHARRFLEGLVTERQPHLVAQVIDCTQLELGLRLTNELKGRGTPLVVLATQHDALRRKGFELDAAALRDALGVEVLCCSVREPGVQEKLRGFLGDALRRLEPAPTARVDAAAVAQAVLRPLEDAASQAARARNRTAKADAWLLHPVFAPFFFIGLMTALFAAVFFVADPFTAFLDVVVRALSARVEAALGPGWLTSLVVDGVLGGAGTVLAFLPQIVILTMAMEVIEASGYLSRGTYIVHRVLQVAGLGGRSFVPLLAAHACAVPAIQSTRIIRDPGQRLRTILVLPLMTCSARIPTYGLLITAFFSDRGVWFKGAAFVSLYAAGILMGFVASLVLGRTVKRTANTQPLVLEMPAYRRPQLRVVLRLGARAATRFVKDVGSVILIASVVLWALLTVPGPGAEAAGRNAPEGSSPRVVAMHGSVAAFVGHALEPITSPAGFDWRINVGLIGSFGARELMVGTLGVIFGIEDDEDVAPLSEKLREARTLRGERAYGVPTGLALMVFFVIACQCMSTLAAVRRETRSWRWPAFVLVYTYGVAWLLAVLTFQGARALGL
ncbi:MAG: ferrous iron transporter B [Myxococcota bacterium]